MELGCRLHFLDKTLYVAQSQLKTTDNSVFEGDVNGAHIRWEFEPYEKGFLISLDVTSENALNIKRIDSLVFSLPAPEKTDRILFLGRNMVENENRFSFELGFNREYTAECTGIVKNFEEKGYLFSGKVPFTNVYKSVALKKDDGSFEFSAKTEFVESMLNSKTLSCEKVYFTPDSTVGEFFDSYQNLIPKSNFPMPKLKGWNTWDYYLDRVKYEDIFENVEALKGSPFKNEIDYIVIDDGWQAGWGNWRENEKFSCGLKKVADKIREAGFVPGIWMAPVRVEMKESIFKEHKDWFLKNENGELFKEGETVAYIDPTHPEAEKYILDNYKYQYDCGFRLFKIDYVSALLKIKSFYNGKSAYVVLSELIEKIKKYTGDDVVILGCSLPLECGADIAPSMRIGVDIHNHFSHVSWIAQSLAWSWMYNLKSTRIDPDFLVVRGEETANEPLVWEPERNDYVPPKKHLQTNEDIMKSKWRHGDQFDYNEAETWANLVAISGGNMFLSDRISELNEKGMEIIENALKISGEKVRPYYQKDDIRLPSLWIGDKGVLVVNWEDIPREITVTGIDGKLLSDKEFALENGVLKVKLLPHQCFSAQKGE